MATVTLRISPAENRPGHYLVVVDGEGFFTSVGKKVGARVRGDDPWFDDHLLSLGIPGLSRVGIGGIFNLSDTVHRSKLNEDPEGRDEIYALVDVEGSGTFKTNQVTGRF